MPRRYRSRGGATGLGSIVRFARGELLMVDCRAMLRSAGSGKVHASLVLRGTDKNRG